MTESNGRTSRGSSLSPATSIWLDGSQEAGIYFTSLNVCHAMRLCAIRVTSDLFAEARTVQSLDPLSRDYALAWDLDGLGSSQYSLPAADSRPSIDETMLGNALPTMRYEASAMLLDSLLPVPETSRHHTAMDSWLYHDSRTVKIS